jgi:hypothetical protein
MTRISNTKKLGIYKNTITGKEYDLRRGTNKQRGVDLIFYFNKGKRQFISDKDFYSIYVKCNITSN